MTADETGPAAQRAKGRGATSSAKAYERRSRREGAVADRLTRTGSPVAAAMSRVPFVAMIILLLAGGIVGVLWLNTMSDATGLQATASRIRQADIETDIESLRKDVNSLKDPARLAAQAAQLGMVPAGDSAMLQVGADGKGTVIGTPTPVAGVVAPVKAAAPPPSAATAVTTAAVTTAAGTTAAGTTAAVTTAARTTAPAAARTTPVKPAPSGIPPAKSTAAPSVHASPAPAKTAAATSTTAKTTSVPRTPPAQQTTTTGAGR